MKNMMKILALGLFVAGSIFFAGCIGEKKAEPEKKKPTESVVVVADTKIPQVRENDQQAAMALAGTVGLDSQTDTLTNVLISASEPTLETPGQSAIRLTLHIEPGIAIYANEPYEREPEVDFIIPTKFEFLDSDDKLVEADFQFPRGTLVNGLYYVYTNTVEITAAFPSDVAVEKLTLGYHGYYWSGNLDSGVC